MNNLSLPENLEDKIYQIQFNSKDGAVSKIISYFPLSEDEKQIIVNLMKNNVSLFDGFHSIFSDHVSEEEWSKSKVQIKKRFQNELLHID